MPPNAPVVLSSFRKQNLLVELYVASLGFSSSVSNLVP